MNVFSLKGRIGRGTYFLWILAISVLMVAFSFISPLFMDVENAISVSKILGVMIAFLFIFPAVHRAHDMGKSAMFPLLPMILNSLRVFFPEGTLPNNLILGVGGIWGLYVGLSLLLVKGTAYPNDYGEPPGNLDPSKATSGVQNAHKNSNEKQAGSAGLLNQDKLENIIDDAFYDEVAKEMQENRMIPGVWTRAFAEADGDENRAKAIYIKLRVEKMAVENRRVGSEADQVYMNGRFENADVVICNGKMWMVDANLCGKMTWEEARAFCVKGHFANYLGWRLPSADELLEVSSQRYKFMNFQDWPYWSASSCSRSDLGVIVDMIAGKKQFGNKSLEFYVWPVRDHFE